jgi:hypothetical protein
MRNQRSTILNGGTTAVLLALALLAGCADPAASSQWKGSPAWSYVGAPGFTTGMADQPVIAFPPGSNIPWVAVHDYTSGVGVVWRLSGTSWVQVGGVFSAGDINLPAFAFTSSGNPVVAYSDSTLSWGVSAVYWNGSAWTSAGTVSASAATRGIAIGCTSGGNVYVAFDDGSVSSRVSVKDYLSSWAYSPVAGGQGFSAGDVGYVSMNVDNNGRVSVAFSDSGLGNWGSMFFSDGGTWANLGPAAFTPTSVWYLDSAVSPSNVQYIVFEDAFVGNKATVMSYSGGAWSYVGTRGFTSGQATNTKIAIDSKGTPHVAFDDSTRGDRVTVMKFDGSSWVMVGSPGFSAGAAEYLDFAISADDTPYVAYRDPSSWIGYRLCVQSFH